MNNLPIRAGDFGNSTSADLLSDLVERLYLCIGLNIVEGVAMSGVSDTVTIDGERAVASSEGRVYVRVVVVVERQIPVSN